MYLNTRMDKLLKNNNNHNNIFTMEFEIYFIYTKLTLLKYKKQYFFY
jgi:hypothetical protein